MKIPLSLIDSKCIQAPVFVVGLTAVVAKGRASVCFEENEKANCLNNPKCRQENPMYYHSEFSHLVWKVM